MEASRTFSKYPQFYLPLLLIVSFVSHFPFVLEGFGEIDAMKIAVSVIDIINDGSDAAFANFYFSDVIPLYILYLKWCMKLLNYNYSSLPTVMNYTNAVFGTLTVIPAFLLIKRLFTNGAIAFYAVLALIFAPSFYQSTIMGFPHLIAFFFILVSFVVYLAAIDAKEKNKLYLNMVLSCIFVTVCFLLKSDYVLVCGAFFGILFMRRGADVRTGIATIVMIFVSGTFFIIFRNMIIGTGGGTTMSQSALSDWYNYSLIIPNNLGYLIRQTKPIAYGAGIITFFAGIAVFLYYLLKKKSDVVVLVLSWVAVPIIFWIVMIGNNARHNMATTLPILVMIVVFFYEQSRKYFTSLVLLVMLGNFSIVSPSYSILTPSGNLIKSNAMLKERMEMFRDRAKEIAATDEKKIAVLGYFHNPHVVFELLKSGHNYKAEKIGREDYKIQIGEKEFIFIYFVAGNTEDMKEEINYIVPKYNLHDYLFVSATYDLTLLDSMGLRSKTVEIIKRSEL